MEYIKIKNSSPAGDLIAMLAGVKQICKDQNKKAIIYQRVGMVGSGYEDAEHPYNDASGNPITMNMNCFLMLKPLLNAQEYITDYLVYHGEEVDMDFDKVRLEIFTNQPKGSLGRYLFHVYPQCATDLSNRWLSPIVNLDWAIEYKDRIIINFTFRYRNHLMDYCFLKKYENKLIFAGLSDEHKLFCETFQVNIPILKVNDFNELASIIACCKFFMGNASMCFWLAEAMKTPRILELSTNVPNVVPIGEHAFDYYHNDEARYYFNKLLNL